MAVVPVNQCHGVDLTAQRGRNISGLIGFKELVLVEDGKRVIDAVKESSELG